MPTDGDLGPMDEAMVALHEVYSAMRKGGFSRGEALTIIAKMASEAMQVGVENAKDTDER